MRVRPFSSEKKAWLLSPPSTVLLFNNPEIPRKLSRPKLPSGTTPGVSRAKVDQRRPLMGNSLMDFSSTLEAKSAWLVLTRGASAVTLTLEEVEPTTSFNSTSVTRPTSTTIFSSRRVAKPDASAVTKYTPGWRLVTRNSPRSSKVAVDSWLVPLLMTLTVAVETVSPCASRTLPPIAPFVVDCAKAPKASSKTAIKASQNRTMEVPIPVVVIEFSPFLLLATLRTLARRPQAPWGEVEAPHILGRDRNGHKRRHRTAPMQHPDFWPMLYHRQYMH